MPSFVVKSRRKGAIEESTVEANTREQAIALAVEEAEEGEEIEVMSAIEEMEEGGGATGATGPVGTSSRAKTAAGPTGR
jgi:hypothetical protein